MSRPHNPGSSRHRTGTRRTITAVDPSEVSVPPMPSGRRWSAEARRWWETAHHSAIAQEWTADDLLVAERLLTFCDDLSRLRRSDLAEDRKLRLAVNVSAEMRLLEASLGLSPSARARLKVEIERSEDAERRRGPRPAAPPTDDELAARRNALREEIRRA